MSKIINSIRRCFTQIPNAIITDLSLSDGAVRVFVYMCSKPDDWQFNNRDIQHKLNIKRAETIAKYWKELLDAGWISRTPKLTMNDKPSGYYDYELNEVPRRPTTKKEEVDTTDKSDTVNQQLLKNRSYTNKELITNTKDNSPKVGGGSSWLVIANKHSLSFDKDEQIAIDNWLRYLIAKQQAISQYQIETILIKLMNTKKSGYDICLMIADTIEAGYKWLVKPMSIYLKQAKSVTVPSRYESIDYIVPETKEQKIELRNYIERCYFRDKVDPRTGYPLTQEQRTFLKSHFDTLKCKSISITDYIYQHEVLTGICILDQLHFGVA